MTRRVEELDSETQSLLAASLTIPTLAILVQELVYNSIDSGATCVAVRVNIDRTSRVQVVDNGSGVQNVAELCDNPPTHKRKVSRSLYRTKRGSLYSIIKLCEKVSVTTRRHNTTLTKSFTSYSKPEVVTEKRNRHSKGTTITIDNVFCNMPVRSASVSYMDLEHTKDNILKIAVANPNVAITLKDIHSGTKLFQTQCSRSPADNFLIYCHHKVDWELFRQVKFEVNGYKLDGMFTVELHHKPRQLVYVNRRCIEDDRIKRFTSDILLSALGTADKKNQENRFPVFLLFISCKPINVDMCFESNSFLEFNDWDSVFTLVYRSISSFLDAEQIPLPMAMVEDEMSRVATPCPSLRSMLRVASPTVNIKSDKAQRKAAPLDAVPAKEMTDEGVCNCLLEKEVIKETILETPKKTNHAKFVPRKRLLSDLNFSPHKNNKSVERCTKYPIFKTPEKSESKSDKSLFKTPPFKLNTASLAKLQNAPVLNHLIEAKSKLDKVEQTKTPSLHVETTFALALKTPSNNPLDTSAVSGITTKRRSSTPLCPSKTKSLLLNLSPIENSKKQNQFLTPSLQIKRKRNHRSSSSSMAKKQATKSEKFFFDNTSMMNKFHVDTPRYVLESTKFMESDYQAKDFNKLFRKTSDSGYDTTSKQSSVFSAFEKSQSYVPELEEDELFLAENKSDYNSTKFHEQPFEVFQDENIETEGNSLEETVDPSPHTFKVYWDETDACTNRDSSCEDQDNSFETKPSAEIFTVYEDEPTQKVEPKACPEIAPKVDACKLKADMKDCASSPIKIPIDRGCSPINFTQLDFLTRSSDVPHNMMEPKTDVFANSPHSDKSHNSASPSPSQGDSFSDFTDSILECINAKIDELTKSAATEPASKECPDDELEVLSLNETGASKSPCMECQTQNVMKRLDFASQATTSVFPEVVNIADKENIHPEYQVSAPVNAATHLVADCGPWANQGPKITITNKCAPFDIRKWRSNVFQTHGEGFLNIQKNASHNMDFLLDACKFDKSVFSGMKVIGQIDDKFIGCVTSNEMLILVDQHAAHERVRLECMLDTLHKDGDSAIIEHPLHTPVPVKFSKSDVEFVIHISTKLKHVGFLVDTSKFHVNITAIPAICFTESGHLNISVDDIVTAFHEAVQQIRESDGSNLTLPGKLVEYLHSKACHGAIRFGDELSLDHCHVLMKQLSACDLPFQCAHGRPSFAPIVKLEKKELSCFKERKPVPTCDELRFLKLRSRFQQ